MKIAVDRLVAPVRPRCSVCGGPGGMGRRDVFWLALCDGCWHDLLDYYGSFHGWPFLSQNPERVRRWLRTVGVEVPS